MYLSRLVLNNMGPLESIDHTFCFNETVPKSTIFVGANGSGKSIVISHIVSAILELQGALFENTEIDSGKVYKSRSALYIRHGTSFFSSDVYFNNGFYASEVQPNTTKSEYLISNGSLPPVNYIAELPENATSLHKSNAAELAENFRNDFEETSFLLFPANRFEEPAWLNQRNLKGVADYSRVSNVIGDSTRTVINQAPLKVNQDWLLDIIYDSYALEQIPTNVITVQGALSQQIVRRGQATDTLNAIGEFLKKLFGMTGQATFSVGRRGGRTISLTIGGAVATNNLFTLSTGQSQVLNIFLSILRDSDLSQTNSVALSDIRGIVLIDEAETNLHTELQYSILPEIIASFPKVQFIITSHSPLFLLGLRDKVGEDLFDLIELPTGICINTERFSKFEAAYRHFTETQAFENDVDQALKSRAQDHLYVEGDIDRAYITRAAELLNRTHTLNRLIIMDGNGSGGLDGIAKRYDSEIAKAIPSKLILLYDCDTKKESKKRDQLFIRKIPEQTNMIKKGIENLFSDSTISKAATAKPAILDKVLQHDKVERGIHVTIPEIWSVNSNEKRNLCDWLIENGDAADFAAFTVIFDMVDAICGDPAT